MKKNQKRLVAGLLVVAALAGLWILYVQDRPDAQALDAPGTPVVATDVPEAASVQEGARAAIPEDHAGPIAMTVYASPTCGCCSDWVSHIEEHGFDVEVIHRDDMIAVKRSLQLPLELASCHTAVVNDYVIEGHVPGEDLRRFLAEAPESRGLTVPGMPLGSPGMEVPSGEVHSYEVLSFTSDGSTSVYAEHGPAQPAGS